MPALAVVPVGYAALLGQVKSVPLSRAVINPPRRHVEIKFPDGVEWEAVYPAGQKAALLRLLHARHVRVVFASPAKAKAKAKAAPGHVRLRYIAAGLAGGLVLVGAGAWAYGRRRRAGGG